MRKRRTKNLLLFAKKMVKKRQKIKIKRQWKRLHVLCTLCLYIAVIVDELCSLIKEWYSIYLPKKLTTLFHSNNFRYFSVFSFIFIGCFFIFISLSFKAQRSFSSQRKINLKTNKHTKWVKNKRQINIVYL